jgi:uncharacterized membrane protein SpoIIM required for sporulation
LIRLLIGALLVIALALIRTGMMTFNREEILSRENEQLSIRRAIQHFKLCFREYHPAGVPFDEYQGLPFSARRFYRHELPALLRDLRLPLIVTLMVTIVGVLIGIQVGIRSADAERVTELLNRVGAPPPSGLDWALYVFARNLRVSIFSNIFSIFVFGIFAAMVPVVAFAQVAFIATSLDVRGGEWLPLGADSPLQFLLAYVLPHGIIELPTFMLSAALGIRIGASVLSPPGNFSVAQNMIWALANFAKAWLLLLLPLVLLAALVEGLISPLVIIVMYNL